MKRIKKSAEYLALACLLLLPLQNLHQGTLHKFDDALYAQVMREVSEGHIFPLTYSGSQYSAKPPLLFWGGGLSAKFLGDHDGSYRFPAAAAFALLLLGVYLLWRKRFGLYPAWLVVLLLAGSPLLAIFSRRVMLDIPLTTLTVGLLLCAILVTQKKNWLLGMGLMAGLGWWVKDIASLPSLVGACLALSILQPKLWRSRQAWLGAGIFLLSAFSLYGLRGFLNPSGWSSVNSVKTSALEFPAPEGLYGMLFLHDHPLLLLLPLAIGWGIYRLIKRDQVAAAVLTSAIILELLAVYLTRTIFPHYLIPAFAVGLLLIGLFLGQSQNRILRGGLIILCLLQLGRANLFRFQPESFEMNPNPIHRELSLEMANRVPPAASICVVDTYFGIFRYYAGRQTLGLYTNPRSFRGLERFAEFRPFIRRVPQSELATQVENECGGLAVMHVGLLPDLQAQRWTLLKEKEYIALLQLRVDPMEGRYPSPDRPRRNGIDDH